MFKKIISISLSLSLMQSCYAMEQAPQQPDPHYATGNGWFGGIGQLFRGVNLKPNGLFVLDQRNGRTIDQVQGWLANHSVDEVDGIGNTLLHVAVQMRNKAVVDLLLENEPNVNIQNQEEDTPLHIAVRVQSKFIAELLLEQRANINIQNRAGDTPFKIATRARDWRLITLLIERGANTDIPEEEGNTLLHVAAQTQQLDLARLLVTKPGLINAQNSAGDTPLHIALRGRGFDIVNSLLNNQADVNIQNSLGDTPLQIALRQDLPNIVLLLLCHAANPGVINNTGNTVFHAAAQSRDDNLTITLLSHPSVTSILKNKTAEECFIDLRNQHGEDIAPQQEAPESPQEGSETALHIAARYGLTKTIPALLANGARKNIVNRAGLTAYDVACRSGNMAVIELLQPPSYWEIAKAIGYKLKPFAWIGWALVRKAPVVGQYIQKGEAAAESMVGKNLMQAGYAQLGLSAPTSAVLVRVYQTTQPADRQTVDITMNAARVAATAAVIGTKSGCIIA